MLRIKKCQHNDNHYTEKINKKSISNRKENFFYNQECMSCFIGYNFGYLNISFTAV